MGELVFLVGGRAVGDSVGFAVGDAVVGPFVGLVVGLAVGLFVGGGFVGGGFVGGDVVGEPVWHAVNVLINEQMPEVDLAVSITHESVYAFFNVKASLQSQVRCCSQVNLLLAAHAPFLQAFFPEAPGQESQVFELSIGKFK